MDTYYHTPRLPSHLRDLLIWSWATPVYNYPSEIADWFVCHEQYASACVAKNIPDEILVLLKLTDMSIQTISVLRIDRLLLEYLDK